MKPILQRKLASLILVSVSLALPLPLVPRLAMGANPPAKARVIKSFDSDWRFYLGEISGAEKTDFDDSRFA